MTIKENSVASRTPERADLSVLDPRFVFLAAALSLVGAYGYLRDTLRGETSPNRVTWGLWGVEGILGFVVEVQQRVGLASVMTLMLGLVPCLVVAASFKNPHGVWKIGRFDIFCGLISLSGLISWSFIDQRTLALCAFVAADQVAALPTLRKSWLVPASESSRVFFLGFLNCTITLFTLKHFSTAGVLFPFCVGLMDLSLGALIVTRMGPRIRHEIGPNVAVRTT